PVVGTTRGRSIMDGGPSPSRGLAARRGAQGRRRRGRDHGTSALRTIVRSRGEGRGPNAVGRRRDHGASRRTDHGRGGTSLFPLALAASAPAGRGTEAPALDPRRGFPVDTPPRGMAVPVA